jgi:hypothetical protein
MIVRLLEGRDKGKHVSVWVCDLHRKPEDVASGNGQRVGETGSPPELAV